MINAQIYEIFNLNIILTELTANMDEYAKLNFAGIMRRLFGNSQKKTSRYNQFLNILQLFCTVLIYYTQSCHSDQDANAYIEQVYQPLYALKPTDSEYKKLPKYLHGVIDRRTNTFRHPSRHPYIIKPPRGQSQQFARQIAQTANTIQYVKQNTKLLHKNAPVSEQIAALQTIYNEIFTLASMCDVCVAPKSARKNPTPGSWDMLHEYRIATNFDTVLNACTNRKQIQQRISAQNLQLKKDLTALQTRQRNEYTALLHEQDLRLGHSQNFDDFKNTLSQNSTQRDNILRTHRSQTLELRKRNQELRAQMELDYAQELSRAQSIISAITRMR